MKRTAKILNFVSALFDKLETNYTLRLHAIEYSPIHGHEICVMQLIGKNAFPKLTPEEILSNPEAMVGLSPQDAVIITKLDHRIKDRKRKCCVLEIDKNGSIVLQHPNGKVIRYSERFISSNRELLSTMKSEDAHDLGYRVGFKDGLNIHIKKKLANIPFKDKILQFIPRIKRKK